MGRVQLLQVVTHLLSSSRASRVMDAGISSPFMRSASEMSGSYRMWRALVLHTGNAKVCVRY